MQQSPWKSATIAQDGTNSTGVDLEQEYTYVNVYIPTITSATLKVQVQDAEAVGSTSYVDVGNGVTTDTTTGGYMETLFIGNHRKIRLVSSAAQGADRTFAIRGWRV